MWDLLSMDQVYGSGLWVYSSLVYGIVSLTGGVHMEVAWLTVGKFYLGLDLVCHAGADAIAD